VNVEEAMERIRSDKNMQVVLLALKFSDMELDKDEALRAARLVIHKDFSEEDALKLVRYDRS